MRNILIPFQELIDRISFKIKRKFRRWKYKLLFQREMMKRSSLGFGELRKLSVDIPRLYTCEIHEPNDYYGIATVIKRYCNCRMNYQIKASIEHGVYFAGYLWDVDIKTDFSGIITMGDCRKEVIGKFCDKSIYPIGPYIIYAEQALSSTQFKKEKKRLGKHLLVLPMHSTSWIEVDYNITKFCKRIADCSKQFDTTRICLYWKDILRGHDKIYKEHGFECVTAGHIYDNRFLPRLKSVIDLADMTMSNGLGTHIGYAVSMGKPHYLINNEFDYTVNEIDLTNDTENRIIKGNRDTDVKYIYRVFNEFKEVITDEQREIVNKYWGLKNIKTKIELNQILQELSDEYRHVEKI